MAQSAKPKRRGRLATRKSSIERSLNVSIAGAKAGGGVVLGSLKRKFGVAGEAESESTVLARESERFVAELGRLKGSYVKIGQLLAQFGEHFLPTELTQALHELGSSTEALPWVDIEDHCRQALGPKRYSELTIEPEAIAAASLAQVHIARCSTDESNGDPEVVLKILYPGLRDSIDSDFDAVIRMLKLGRFLQLNRDLDVWMNSLREQLQQETDYRRERRMTAKMAELTEELCEQSPLIKPGSVQVPQVVERYCRGELLALQKLSGFSVNSEEVQGLSQQRRNQLGMVHLELFFAELFAWGMLQTDPNFGNYLIKPAARVRGPDAGPDTLVLLDFGAVQKLPAVFLENFRSAIACGLSGDREGLIGALTGLSCLEASSSEETADSFAEFCVAILEPMWPEESLPAACLNSKGQYRWADSQLMKRAGKLAADASFSRQFNLPGVEFALIARKLIGVFTFISVLGAEFNGHPIADRYIRQWQAGLPKTK